MGSEQALRARDGVRFISRMANRALERPGREYPREALHKTFDAGCLASE